MGWNCAYSIKGLPDKIRESFQKRANFLHLDLKLNKYKGELVELPYTKYHFRQRARFTVSTNPLWYSQFYWENTPHVEIKYSDKVRRRRLKKTLDRGRVSLALRRIADNEDKDFFRYHTLMRETILDYLLDGVPVGDFEGDSKVEIISRELLMEPDNDVREFFGLERVPTYKDELLEFYEKYGEDGDIYFFRQYEKDDSDIPF